MVCPLRVASVRPAACLPMLSPFGCLICKRPAQNRGTERAAHLLVTCRPPHLLPVPAGREFGVKLLLKFLKWKRL